ncbi:hypothetical protein [Dysgonomonas gadei]|uniref:hypothetical protein n=1 Tax=Dysgonomonas gadei TaxID=156974 RepID=UPI003AEF1882
MIEDKDKIKDLFSSKLGNFEPEVPASIWGGLDQLLSNQPVQAPDASSSSSSANSSTANAASSTSKASTIKTVAIAVGVAAAIAIGILSIPTDDKPIMEDANVVVTEGVKTPVETQDVDTVIEVPKVVPPLLAKARAIVEPVEAVATTEPEPEPEVVSEPLVKEEVKEEKKEVKAAPMLAQTRVILPEAESPSKGLSLGITVDAGLFADNVNERGGDILFSRKVRSSTFRSALNKENSEFELEHKQPISFGVTISKQIAPKLSFETGLVYTHLSSKIKSSSVFNISESQYFNYLGIPLSLNYTFFELGKTKFYFALGGMVQKDINGRYVSNMGFSMLDIEDKDLAGHVFYSEPYYIRESVKQSNPQFSVRSSLGISYPLYKKMYLYGTIGGAYYFDARNKYRTIYSDRKTQLDLNLGIKFDF